MNAATITIDDLVNLAAMTGDHAIHWFRWDEDIMGQRLLDIRIYGDRAYRVAACPADTEGKGSAYLRQSELNKFGSFLDRSKRTITLDSVLVCSSVTVSDETGPIAVSYYCIEEIPDLSMVHWDYIRQTIIDRPMTLDQVEFSGYYATGWTSSEKLEAITQEAYTSEVLPIDLDKKQMGNTSIRVKDCQTNHRQWGVDPYLFGEILDGIDAGKDGLIKWTLYEPGWASNGILILDFPRLSCIIPADTFL